MGLLRINELIESIDSGLTENYGRYEIVCYKENGLSKYKVIDKSTGNSEIKNSKDELVSFVLKYTIETIMEDIVDNDMGEMKEGKTRTYKDIELTFVDGLFYERFLYAESKLTATERYVKSVIKHHYTKDLKLGVL